MTFLAGLQLDLAAVAAVASVSPSSDPEHVRGAGFQALDSHRVGFRL